MANTASLLWNNFCTTKLVAAVFSLTLLLTMTGIKSFLIFRALTAIGTAAFKSLSQIVFTGRPKEKKTLADFFRHFANSKVWTTFWNGRKMRQENAVI